MGILDYQLVIAIIILIASLFGRKGWWVGIILTTVWTLANVFMAWVLIVQYITIAIAGALGYLVAIIMDAIYSSIYKVYRVSKEAKIKKSILKSANSEAEAHYELASRYDFGYELTQNKQKAIEHYQKAKELGHPNADNNLQRVKAGCFIVTVCFPETDSVILNSYRNFRDIFLSKYSFGKKIINVYYKIGPGLANYIESKSKLKSFIRIILLRFYRIFFSKF